MHVSDVHIIHSTTYYDPCYNPIFQAMKHYVATLHREVDCIWNVMAHAQKPDFVFRWNGQLHLNWRGLQFSRLLEAEVCASAVVMLDMPCSEVVWRILATHSIRQFPLHFPSRASPCAITLQLGSTYSSPLSCFFLKQKDRKTDIHTTKLTAQHVTVIGDMVRYTVVKTHNLHLLINTTHFTEILTFNFLAWDLTWSSSLIESMNPW